jgi:hypothetical protein
MLKYNIKKRKHWVHPLGAYIASKELNPDPDSLMSREILSQAQSIFPA